MKICLIHNLYEPFARGGAEVLVKSLMDALVSRGDEVVVITSVPWKNRGVERKDRLTVYRIPSYNLCSYADLSSCPFWLRCFWHVWNMGNVWGAWRVKQILKKEGCAVVMTHNLIGLSFLIPSMIRSLKMKHIHVLHDVGLVVPSGVLFFGTEKKQLGSLFSRVVVWVNRFLFGSPDVLVSPSQFLMDFYTQKRFFLRSEKKVVPNPITPASPSMTKKSGPFTILFVGQVEAHKGIHVLLEAFRTLISLSPQARLWVVGGGSLLPSLQQRKDYQVAFFGRQEHTKLTSFYMQADVVVVPSLCYENWPTVVFEAWSCGIPVIVSHVGGMAELQTFAFEPGNVDSLVSRFVEVERNPQKAQEMAQKGQEFVKKCTMEQYLKKIEL